MIPSSQAIRGDRNGGPHRFLDKGKQQISLLKSGPLKGPACLGTASRNVRYRTGFRRYHIHSYGKNRVPGGYIQFKDIFVTSLSRIVRKKVGDYTLNEAVQKPATKCSRELPIENTAQNLLDCPEIRQFRLFSEDNLLT